MKFQVKEKQLLKIFQQQQKRKKTTRTLRMKSFRTNLAWQWKHNMAVKPLTNYEQQLEYNLSLKQTVFLFGQRLSPWKLFNSPA